MASKGLANEFSLEAAAVTHTHTLTHTHTQSLLFTQLRISRNQYFRLLEWLAAVFLHYKEEYLLFLPLNEMHCL